VITRQGRKSWGLGPPDFGQRVWGSQGVVKYYYMLSRTGSMLESGDF